MKHVGHRPVAAISTLPLLRTCQAKIDCFLKSTNLNKLTFQCFKRKVLKLHFKVCTGQYGFACFFFCFCFFKENMKMLREKGEKKQNNSSVLQNMYMTHFRID